MARPVEPTGELREQLMAYLQQRYAPPGPFGFATRDWLIEADALLSGPLAPLLAKLRAVEALADDAVKDNGAAQFKLTDALWIHGVWAFNGTQIACGCDYHFRSAAEHREHLADALLPVVDEIAGKRAAEAEAKAQRVEALAKVLITAPGQGPIAAALIYGALAGGDEQAFAEYERQALDASPAPEPVTHNHTRFRNDAGPWSPCPVSCPAAGLLR